MPAAFVDAAYYIALLVPRDRLHTAAVALMPTLTGTRRVTSEPVLVEVLAKVARIGSHSRTLAVQLVDELRADPFVTIVPQTPELFEDGLRLYRERLDKSYSLTDAMSMSICRRLGIADVLTSDRHFEQEGFSILL